MHIDPSLESTDYQTIAVMVAILAGLVGLLGFAINDPTVDLAQVQPIVVAHTNAATGPEAAPSSATGAPAVKSPEENWAPDESSHGMRPDAAH